MLVSESRANITKKIQNNLRPWSVMADCHRHGYFRPPPPPCLLRLQPLYWSFLHVGRTTHDQHQCKCKHRGASDKTGGGGALIGTMEALRGLKRFRGSFGAQWGSSLQDLSGPPVAHALLGGALI